MSQPAVSRHLKVLERAGLVSVGRDGQRRPRRIEPEPLEVAKAWIERYRAAWEESFQRLDALLEELGATSGGSPVRGEKGRGGDVQTGPDTTEGEG